MVIPEELSPRIETSPVQVGGVAILKCQIATAVGLEALITSWLIQKTPRDRPVSLPDAGRYIYGHAGTLYVLNVRERDSAMRFICQVTPKKNKATGADFGNGRDILGNSAEVLVKSPPESLKIKSNSVSISVPHIDSSLTRSVQVADGTPFSIPCIASANPQPRFSWIRDDHSRNAPITTLNNAIGINMPSSSDLWARGPILGSGRSRASHEGSYTCLVANSQGSDRATFTLVVTEELRVSILPKQQSVSAGGRAVIRCNVYGAPVAEVRWYKDGVPLLHRSHILVQGREVIVGGASGRDVGVYQCVAANSLGEAQSASYLSIRESKPELTHKFIAQTLHPGPSVTLTCAALGHPMPSLTWILDGQPVNSHSSRFPSSKVSVGSWVDGSGQVVGQVNISSVSILDGGLYECEASNRVGRTTHRSRLNVYGPPTTRPAANLTAISKREAVLPCPVAGFPLMDIQWRIDSRPLTPTLRRYSKGDGTLYIREVESSQDSKRYTCSATNAQGVTAEGHFFLGVLNPPVLADIKFPDNLFEGMRLSVLCTLLEGDVPISIRWSRDGGSRIPQDPTVSQSHAHFYSNLVFTQVQGKHAGTYTCTASNTAASASVSAVMNVKVPPVWVVEPEDLEVVAGEDFDLECHSSGTPMPTVTWRRHQGDTSVLDSPEVVSDGWRITLPRPGTLRIRASRPQDGGQYVCHAENGVTPALSKTISVGILEGAHIEETVGNETVGIGTRLKLKCEARGHLPIIFTWSQHGAPIIAPASGISFHEAEGGRLSMLVVESATREHAAVYTCQAANAHGADTKTFFVSVVENPDPPAHVHVLRVTSREVFLAWAPPFDGNSPLTHYAVRVKISGQWETTTISNTTVGATETKAMVQGLTPGTRYHLDVVAVNALGESKPSPTLSVMTKMEAPSVPPTGITATASKKGSLTVSWQPPGDRSKPVHLGGYQIGHRVEGSSNEFAWRSVRASTTSVILTGLRHFTTYEITVKGVNAVGAGPPATPIKAKTSQAEPSDSPQNMECVPLSSQALRVRWDAVPLNASHGLIQGYKVFFRKVSDFQGSYPVEVKRTTNLETNLQGLKQFTNYTLRVLAFNAAGDGKLSNSVTCATQQDKPGAPNGIKALTAGERSILVSWLPPRKMNGIISHYSIYYRPHNAQQGTSSVVVESHPSSQWEEVSKLVEGLDSHSQYEFWVKASTSVGEGHPSKSVPQRPGIKVPAKIKSFGQVVEGISGHSLTLPCNVIGHPPPSVVWNPPVQTLADYSLRFATLHSHHSGNYSCSVRNVHGRDKETWNVRVVSAPPSPTCHIRFTTESTIVLSWTVTGDGGKPITGFIIQSRESSSGQADQEGAMWKEREVGQRETQITLQNMKCGTMHYIQVIAVNPIGRGQPSPLVATKTRGSVPDRPSPKILISLNATTITFHLYIWPNGGCPMLYFLVTYRSHSSDSFETPVRLPGTTDSYTLKDLTPSAWYDAKVVACNTVGPTTASYQIATPSLAGVTLAPEQIIEVTQAGLEVPAYLDPHVLAPIVSGIACTSALLLCVAIGFTRGSCFGRRKKQKGVVRESESKSALFFRKSIHDGLSDHEDLSPAARAKHEEAYGVEETTYEICPYATFNLPPMATPFPGTPSNNPDAGDVLDYSLQFQTFGHQECLEGQQKQQATSGAVSPEIRCLSSDQTLPIGSAVPRIAKIERNRQEAETNISDSDPDDTSEGGAPQSKDAIKPFRVPIKLKRGTDFSFHPPDSSTESNDERSPQPPRRPPHLSHHSNCQSQKQDSISKQHRSNLHQPRRQQSQQHPPSAGIHPRRSATFDGVYSVDGSLCGNTALKEHPVGSPLRPPTGFLDPREFSEAECDRDSAPTKKGRTGKGGTPRLGHAFSPPASQNVGGDYSIHV